MKKIILLTNIPSPYRVLQFDRLYKLTRYDISIIYDEEIEGNRHWKVPELTHQYKFNNTLKNKCIGLIKILSEIKPDAIIVSGFNYKILFTFLYSIIFNKKYIIFTDSWELSVNNLKFYHRFVRKLFVPFASAYICVGKKGKDFLKNYGADYKYIFISPLSIDNEYYKKSYIPIHDRYYDFIFSGQFIDRKMPHFVVDVLKGLKDYGIKPKILLIGTGPLCQDIIDELQKHDIDFEYPGFIQQEELPRYYSNSKLLLFPTKDDPWGLVANEACAAGTPVITCNNAGAAGDLIIDGYNGCVLPLKTEVWIRKILSLIQDENILMKYSDNSLRSIENYTIEEAAVSIEKTLNYVLQDDY